MRKFVCLQTTWNCNVKRAIAYLCYCNTLVTSSTTTEVVCGLEEVQPLRSQAPLLQRSGELLPRVKRVRSIHSCRLPYACFIIDTVTKPLKIVSRYHWTTYSLCMLLVLRCCYLTSVLKLSTETLKLWPMLRKLNLFLKYNKSTCNLSCRTQAHFMSGWFIVSVFDSWLEQQPSE